MKTNYLFLSIILVLVGFSGCEKKFDAMNIDPNRPSSATPGVLLGQLQYQLVNNRLDEAKGLNHTLMQVTAPRADANLNSTMRWFIGPGSGIWEQYYGRLLDINDLYLIAEQLGEPNYQAIALVLKSYVFSLLTDLYGDIPYSEASKGLDGLFQPKFDEQQDVYAGILADLETANNLFDVTKRLSFGGDLIYEGDAAEANILKWKKFGNSLRIRMLLRAIKRDGELQVSPQITAMLADRQTYPIFESNADDAILNYPGTTPYFNPYYNARTFDWRDNHYFTTYFIDPLNEWDDPRRAVWARTVTVGGNPIYRGIETGYAIGTEYDVDANSNYSDGLKTSPLLGVLMGYAEVEFILAELTLRGFDTGSSARGHYEKGIAASMNQWGVSVPAGYFSQPSVLFDEDAPAEEQLAKIMQQKYYALFFTDYQSWFEKRRTGYPALPKGPSIPAQREFPRRIPYPLYLQSMNPTNLAAAVASMGGDDCYIRVWWDK